MALLSLDSSIDQLFENKLIDGETYLYCLDNDINKFDAIYDLYKIDMQLCMLKNCNSIIQKELIQLCTTDLEDDAEETTLVELENSNIDSLKSDLENDSNNFNIVIIYQTFKIELSRRTKNILEYVERQYNYPNQSFFEYLLGTTNPHSEFLNIRNAGKNTVVEIVEFVNKINEQIVSFNTNTKLDINFKRELDLEVEENIFHSILDSLSFEKKLVLENQFFLHLDKLSIRSNNRVNELYRQCDSSIIEFCKELTDSKFNWYDVRNIGKKSFVELEDLSNFLINTITDLSKETDSNYMKSFQFNSIQKKLNISEDFAEELFSYNQLNNHFPFFQIIDRCLKNKGRDWEIIEGTIKLFKNQKLINLVDLAPKLSITRERIRQRRRKIIESLKDEIGLISKNDLIDIDLYKKYTVLSLDNSIIDCLNNAEFVDFNSNFIYFILSIAFSKSFILLGDESKSFLDIYDDSFEELFLIPKEINDIFNVESFLFDFNLKLNQDTYEDYSIQLESLVLLYFKDEVYIEKLNEIINICEIIIYKKFGILNEIDGSIIIRKNTTKNLPDIAEDVLRKEMRQMSLEEIFEEIENIIPGLCKNSVALRGSILRNKNIIPVGRESVYVLKEWHELGIKGGTIRDLVVELLLPLEQPLSLDDITKYVKTHRNDTDSYSIYNNLRLDKSKQFSFYQDDGLRYIGLTSKSYSLCNLDTSEFKNYDRKDFKERLAEIEEFILENNRFPFSSTIDINEESLYRFMNIQRGKIKKGTLSVEQLNDIEIFEKKFGSFEMSKRDFDWDINFNQIKEYIALNGCFPTVKANTLLYGWLQRQSRFIREDKLSEYQIDKLKTLYNIELDA